MHGKSLLFVVLTAVVMLLMTLACRAAPPTATPVPPTPTKAPAPTVAPAPTIAPAPTVAPAPAPTVAPTATRAPAPTLVPPTPTSAPRAATVADLPVPQTVKNFLNKYPDKMTWITMAFKPTTQPKYGGTFTRGPATAGGTFGPAHWDTTISTAANSSGAGACYGGLLRLSADLSLPSYWRLIPSPDAAESWRRLDELNWEFKLNPNVFWHDIPGRFKERRVTAEDIKFNLDYYREKSVYAGSLDIIADVQIKDPSTIVVKTTIPYALLLRLLADDPHGLFPPELLAQPGGLKPWCVSIGPFKLVEFTPGQFWAVERNPKYHNKGATGLQLPYLDRVEVIGFADAASQFAAIITNKVHLMSVTTGRDLEKVFSGTPTPNVKALIKPNGPTAQWHLGMRLDKPPFNDVRVRRALSMGIDRPGIIATAFSGMGSVSQQIPYDSLGLGLAPIPQEERGPWLQFNVEAAKKLLAEAGYPNGFSLTQDMVKPSGPALAMLEIVQQDWKKLLNVDVKWNILDTTAFNARYYGRTYDQMVYQGTLTNSSSYDSYAYGRIYSKSVSNDYRIDDPELDKLALAQRKADEAEQRKIFKQILDRMTDQVYIIELISPFVAEVYHSNLENFPGRTYGWISSWGTKSMEQIWWR